MTDEKIQQSSMAYQLGYFYNLNRIIIGNYNASQNEYSLFTELNPFVSEILAEIDHLYSLLFRDSLIIPDKMYSPIDFEIVLELTYDKINDSLSKEYSELIEMFYFVGGLISICELSHDSIPNENEFTSMLLTLLSNMEIYLSFIEIKDLVKNLNSEDFIARRFSSELFGYLLADQSFSRKRAELIKNIDEIIS